MTLKWISIATVGLLGACQVSQTNDGANTDAPAARAAPPAGAEAPTPVAPGAAAAPGDQPLSPVSSAPKTPESSRPSYRPSLPEPKGPIDPKSAEAAGQIVQKYGALIEQSRWDEARTLWGSSASADAFHNQLKAYSEVHLNIGNLGQPEGAAGSIYLTEPVNFYGKTSTGKALDRKSVVTLRRVNGVDGSTAAQRRWHIERIEWK